MTLKLELAKLKQKTFFVIFFKCLLNFRAYALQLEHNKVGYTNFVKFQLQGISSKIERAFENMTKFSIKTGSKKTIFSQVKGP